MNQVHYQGITIEITPTGYIVANKRYNTLGQAKKAAWRARNNK